MSSSDQIMLDSPAQTPDAKSQHPPNLRAGASSTTRPDDIAMMIEDPNAESVGGWDTKKWREDLQIATSKLQHHPQFNPAKYRDPMSKPLVTSPPDLTADMAERLRKRYDEAIAAQKSQDGSISQKQNGTRLLQ